MRPGNRGGSAADRRPRDRLPCHPRPPPAPSTPTVNGIDAALADAARLRAAAVGEHGYALAYGSHAQAHTFNFNDSDLDLLYVGAPLPEDRREWLIGAVLALHHEHGLRLDTEVAYGVKLHATPADVEAAL